MARQPLYESEEQKLLLIERNGYKQSEYVAELAQKSGRDLKLTADLIRALHRLAIQDICECAGQFRTWPITIIRSQHVPPPGGSVEGLVETVCEYVNSDDTEYKDPTSTAVVLLWKLNWIHPFGGGNGRTARAATYLLLCARLGFFLPGRPTLASYIAQNRDPYMDALVDADTAWKQSSVSDVSKMKSFLDRWLERQLASVPAPPRPVVARRLEDPSMLEPGRMIQSGVSPQLPPDDIKR